MIRITFAQSVSISMPNLSNSTGLRPNALFPQARIFLVETFGWKSQYCEYSLFHQDITKRQLYTDFEVFDWWIGCTILLDTEGLCTPTSHQADTSCQKFDTYNIHLYCKSISVRPGFPYSIQTPMSSHFVAYYGCNNHFKQLTLLEWNISLYPKEQNLIYI